MSHNSGDQSSNAPQTPTKPTPNHISFLSSTKVKLSIVRTPRSGKKDGSSRNKFAMALASLYDDDTTTTAKLESPGVRQDHVSRPLCDLEAKPSDSEGSSVTNNCCTYSPSSMLPSGSARPSLATEASFKSEDIRGGDESQNSGSSDAGEDIGRVSGISMLHPNIRNEWIGTSQFYTEHAIVSQVNGDLDKLIDYRKAIINDTLITPYDPALFINLSQVDSKLGFTDVAVGNAHRALLLIESALDITIHPKLPSLGMQVRNILKSKLGISPQLLNDSLKDLRLKAYRELLDGLLGCGAFWDGLQEAKVALKLFPDDSELIDLRVNLKDGFKARHHGLKALGHRVADLIASSRTGNIYQKKYPWMDQALYFRTPSLMKEINTTLKNENCEIRPVVFGPQSEATIKPEPIQENHDVGPLGIFATRNIQKGEVILVDKTLLGISDIPSSRLFNCDACHACLLPPYRGPTEVVYSSCCKSVAYCSQYCHDIAINGYHSVLCGRDMDWLYEETGTSNCHTTGPGTHWRPILFLRLVAIVLADMRNPSLNRLTHPLQHHLIARMAANYAPNKKLTPDLPQDWQFSENVTMPTKILLDLGVDIFKNRGWDQEVLQTMYWRIENNANAGVANLFPGFSPLDTSQPTSSKNMKHQKTQSLPISLLSPSSPTAEDFIGKGGTVNTTNLNPNYLFFNHSCLPNTTWHSALPGSDIDTTNVADQDIGMLLLGNSAVKCTANRDIMSGEELKISYVGDASGAKSTGGDVPENTGTLGSVAWEETVDDNRETDRASTRGWLKKWFEDGCGCEICEAENEIERQSQQEQERNAELQTKTGKVEEVIPKGNEQ